MSEPSPGRARMLAPVAFGVSALLVATVALLASTLALRGLALAAAGVALVLCLGGLGFIAVRSARVERALLASQARLGATVESSPDGIVTLFHDGTIAGWNRTASLIFGHDERDVIGRPLIDFVDEADRSALVARMVEVFRGSPEAVGRPLLIRSSRSDGAPLSVEATFTSWATDDGRFAAAFLRDVTEAHRVRDELVEAKDAAESAVRARADFLARMSHEIRTPLNGILGMVDLSLLCELSTEVRDNLETARSSANLLLTLVNDILDFSRVDAGKLRIDEVPFSVRDTVAGALRGLSGRAFDKGLALILDVADDVPQRVVGDPQRFQQVLVNLVANAIKFTEKGEVVVEVTAPPRPTGVVLQVAVSDTGIGIPETALASIFDAFQQGERDTARRFGGAGLGLAICRELVTLMDGTIHVESEPGKGTQFTFTVVVRPGSRAGVTVLAPFRRASLLLVEKNARQRELLAKTLRSWDLTTTAVDAGDVTAIDAAGGAHRLILLDALAPSAAVARLARRLGVGKPGGPEVVLMAPSGLKIAPEVQRLSPVAQVTKPISSAQLHEILGAVLGGTTLAVPTLPLRPVGARTRRRILLAEDNAVNRRVARGFLERAGADVVEVENGRDALAALEKGGLDLALIDLEMPIMGGLEAMRTFRARERDAGRVHLPIVAVTAQAMVGDQERCLEAGADAYIAKPFDARDLAAVIEKLAPGAPLTGPISAPGTDPPKGRAPVIIDREELLRRIGGSSEVLAEIVTMFLGEAPGLRDELARVAERDDADDLARVAHKLKGMLASMSATDAAEVARKLEENVQDGGRDRVRALAARLDEAMRAVEAELGKETRS